MGFLRRLSRRPAGNPSGNSASLSNSLLLVIGRRAPTGESRRRTSASFGRRSHQTRVSIWEYSEDQSDEVKLTTSLPEIATYLRQRLDPAAQSELFDLIVAATMPDLEKPDAYTLAKSLNLLRQRLRQPLVGMTFESGQPAVIDSLYMVDERSVWVTGWCLGGDDLLERIELITPEGMRAGSLKGANRFARADVADLWRAATIEEIDHGFLKFLELPAPSFLTDGWLCELHTRSGGRFEFGVPPISRDPADARGSLLSYAAADRPNIDELRRDHAKPALERIQAYFKKSLTIENVVQHGEAPPAPEVSIVVPLYERVDLIEHQIAQFWHDPEIAEAELIYVLDSPAHGPQLTTLAAELHALYGLPFTVLKLNRNGGFSAANNIAAAHARGRLLLLLNSDVLPMGPGWLGTMRSFYDATPGIGALGPKLLYEDESIQHAGMYFQLDPTTRLWENQHYYKGFSRALGPANVSRPVPAVTGACMMLDRSVFHEVGGLREDYIQGGFEDSDLCLRLIDAGYDNWYVSTVELYHLEAQSFPIELRSTKPYNGWLQTHLWDARIREVMQKHSEAADSRVTPVG